MSRTPSTGGEPRKAAPPRMTGPKITLFQKREGAKSKHLSRSYCVLSTSYGEPYSSQSSFWAGTLTYPFKNKKNFFFFTEREAEAQRGEATCSRAYSQEMAELNSKPGLSDSKSVFFPPQEKVWTSQEHFKLTVCGKTPSKAESWVEWTRWCSVVNAQLLRSTW